MQNCIILLVAFCLDLLLGDPKWLYHPVQGMGVGITQMEKWLRNCLPKTPAGELWGGLFLACAIPGMVGLVLWMLLEGMQMLYPPSGMLLRVWFCYQFLALKSLGDASGQVYDALQKAGLEAGRHAVSHIVGRDVETLTQEGVIQATVETVAENTTDGVIAPLFYMALGGPILGGIYKAVNTLDSMVGYKNEKYLYFGRASAKLDDLFNWLPARLAGWVMVASAFVIGLDGKGAFQIYKRDRKKHKSPNAAHTEAACAGALGICLGGDAYYFGTLYKKEKIGEATRAVEIEDILRARHLSFATSVGVLLLIVLMQAGFLFFQ